VLPVRYELNLYVSSENSQIQELGQYDPAADKHLPLPPYPTLLGNPLGTVNSHSHYPNIPYIVYTVPQPLSRTKVKTIEDV
jgi:hypothetical protein